MLWKRSNFSWPITQWTMQNVSLKYPQKQILLINYVHPEVHSGKYECIAENEVTSVKRYFQLHVEDKL